MSSASDPIARRNAPAQRSVLSLLLFAITSSTLAFLLPFYIQDVLHHSPSFMGLLFLSAPALTIGLAPVAGQLTDRIGPRIPASIGLTVIMVGFVIGTLLQVDSHWGMPVVLLACTGIGQGFFNTPNQTAIIASVPREYRGFATGLVQMVFGIGSLLGISLGGALLTVLFRYDAGIDASSRRRLSDVGGPEWLPTPPTFGARRWSRTRSSTVHSDRLVGPKASRSEAAR